MALETGTASGWRDFWRKLANFQLNNADVISEGVERTVNLGYFNPDVDYLTSLQFEESGTLQTDVSNCMGWDDTDQLYTDSGRKISWLARLIDDPNWLGFSSTNAVSPTYYTVAVRQWLGETSKYPRTPKDWYIEYSDDNAIWNVSDSESGESNWDPAESRTYTITETTPHKYWRMRITSTHGDPSYVEVGRLRFYDSGDNWISRGYTSEYLFRAPGWAGTDYVYYGMRLSISPNEYYNIQWMGAIGYDSNYGWTGQPSDTNSRYTPMWEFDMPYWFSMNGARLITVANVAERWIASYNGKFFPFGTPAQYPYPMITSGSSGDYKVTWEDSLGVGHIQALHSYGTYAGAVYRPNNYWTDLSGMDQYGNINGAITCIAPAVSAGMANGNRQMPDSAYALVPYIVEIDNDAYGTLDGIRWISGDNQIPGNIILDETGQEWLVFCNHHHITLKHFAAMELK